MDTIHVADNRTVYMKPLHTKIEETAKEFRMKSLQTKIEVIAKEFRMNIRSSLRYGHDKR